MTVTKTLSGAWRTYAGTEAEIVAALAAEKIAGNQVVGYTYDPDTSVFSALVRTGPSA